MERNDFAVRDIAFFAPEFQAIECATMSVNVRQIAGNEKADLLAFAAHHPNQHAVASRLA
jgi:hypothetical protein